MQSRFLLNVVVRERAAILELFPCEDEALLIWWDAFLVLDLRLDRVDAVAWLEFEGYGLAGQSLDEDLHLYIGGGAKNEDRQASTSGRCCHGAIPYYLSRLASDFYKLSRAGSRRRVARLLFFAPPAKPCDDAPP